MLSKIQRAMTCTLSGRYFGLSVAQTVTYYLNM